MRGRQTDRWQRSVAGQPWPDMGKALSLAGVGGGWVNRDGYEDAGAEAEAQLSHPLGTEPPRSPDNRLMFFSMTYVSSRSSSSSVIRP